MADNFHLDPDAARNTTSKSKSSADTLRDAFAKLTATLDEHDGCWGRDDIGSGFADGDTGYVAKSKTTQSNVSATMDGLDSWTDGVNEAVKGFTELDGQNADAVDHDFAHELKQPPPDNSNQ